MEVWLTTEVQTIMRDLWALRLEMLKDTIGDSDVEVPTQLFSTQTDTDDSENDQRRRYASRATFHAKLPKLIESLGLCYLALVLLRLPIYYADVRSWAITDGFVYLRAVQALPLALRQRLPQNLRSGLEARVSSLRSSFTFQHDVPDWREDWTW